MIDYDKLNKLEDAINNRIIAISCSASDIDTLRKIVSTEKSLNQMIREIAELKNVIANAERMIVNANPNSIEFANLKKECEKNISSAKYNMLHAEKDLHDCNYELEILYPKLNFPIE